MDLSGNLVKVAEQKYAERQNYVRKSVFSISR